MTEQIARAAYDQWADRPGWVPWVEGGNSPLQDEARKVAKSIEAAWNTRAAPALPVLEGWKLVPVEPTEAMIVAADRTGLLCQSIGRVSDGVTTLWTAMLSASPPDEGSSRSQPIVASNDQTEEGA